VAGGLLRRDLRSGGRTEALAEQKRDLAARLAEVAQQSGAALEAAQRAVQAQQEAFSQVTAERDLLAAEVGDLREQIEELQERAKRPWWAIWRGR